MLMDFADLSQSEVEKKKPWKGQFDEFFMSTWADPGFFLRRGAPLRNDLITGDVNKF